MAKKIIGFYKLFLGFILTAIGFSACGKHERVGALEYGSPYEKLKLSGSVVDKNNNPVPNVKLQLKFIVHDRTFNHPIAIPTTNNKGEIYYESNQTFTDTIQVTFVKSGNTEEAQRFKDDSIRIKKVKISDLHKGWMTGEAEAKFTLKLQNE